MPTPIYKRDQQRREALRAVGIWGPDTVLPDFVAECRRQAALVAVADQRDPALYSFIDAALVDLGECS